MDYFKELYEPLFQKLETAIPFSALPVRELVQILREKGLSVTLKTKLTVTKVFNSGDISGIVCTVGEKDGSVFICSLTHLIFEPTFPLYKDIISYQKRRAKRIEQLNKM